jgi:hypothetical protein
MLGSPRHRRPALKRLSARTWKLARRTSPEPHRTTSRLFWLNPPDPQHQRETTIYFPDMRHAAPPPKRGPPTLTDHLRDATTKLRNPLAQSMREIGADDQTRSPTVCDLRRNYTGRGLMGRAVCLEIDFASRRSEQVSASDRSTP